MNEKPTLYTFTLIITDIFSLSENLVSTYYQKLCDKVETVEADNAYDAMNKAHDLIKKRLSIKNDFFSTEFKQTRDDYWGYTITSWGEKFKFSGLDRYDISYTRMINKTRR